MLVGIIVVSVLVTVEATSFPQTKLVAEVQLKRGVWL